MTKFSTKKFGGIQEKYPRDRGDNKYYSDIQVKNIKGIITEDFTLYIDADSLCFKAAAIQDEAYVVVTHKESGEELEFKNKTAFKGRARGDRISQDSYLGRENLKREAKKTSLLEVADYEIVQKKRLKPDGSLAVAVQYIEDYIGEIKRQTEVENLQFLIGSGAPFREDLQLPEKYKGNRDGQERPILLKEVREYLNTNHPCQYEDAKETGFEVDDRVSMYAWEGYCHYRKTGKFNKGQAGIDKDAYGTPSLMFNYDKVGVKFKLPQAVVIEATDKSIGTIEMVGSDCKCTGLLQVCFQILTSDSADNYSAYLKFPKAMHPEVAYSDASFFKEFYPLTTPLECLQTLVDRFLEWFPQGLQYTDWKGEEVDCDTLTWINTLFQCVYMKRSDKDNTTFTSLAERVGVDLGEVVGNNKLTAPVPVFVDNKEAEEKVALLKEMCDDMFSEIGSYKSLKKPDLVKRLDNVKNSMEQMYGQFEAFYELKQLEKGE